MHVMFCHFYNILGLYNSKSATKEGNEHTKDTKRKSDRKKSILQMISKLPLMDSQAKVAMLGVATKRKKTGLRLDGI